MTGSPAPSHPRHSLTPVESVGDDAYGFVQESESSPVLRDNWPDGIDYVCGHCEKVVLAACVADDQLWDLAFQCPGCKGVSMSPSLPRGMSLPQHVLTLPGLNPMAPVDLRGRVMVGKAAIDRVIECCGPQGSTFGSLAKRPPKEGDAKLMEQLVADFRRLLGDAFDKLDEAHQRGLRLSSKTPPAQPHPLMAAVQDLRRAIATFAAGAPLVDDRPLMELLTLRDTLERWKRHPFYPKLVQGLVGEYQHTVILLAAATALVDCGNGVVFQESVSHQQTPDVLLVLGAHGQRASVEVKVPPELAAPKGALGYETLLRIVEKTVKRSREQQGGERPGLLVIGGFHLHPSDANDLERAATDYLAEAARKKKHTNLMGILLLVFVSGFKRTDTQVDVGAALYPRLVKHPGYQGAVGLHEGRAP